METITIKTINSIEDAPGKFGPQKKIVFVDSRGRTISGWIPLESFDYARWVAGGSLEMEIAQNGKYTNFKLPSKKQAQEATNHSEIMGALRMLYKEVQAISRRLTEMKSAPHYPENMLGKDSLEDEI